MVYGFTVYGFTVYGVWWCGRRKPETGHRKPETGNRPKTSIFKTFSVNLHRF